MDEPGLHRNPTLQWVSHHDTRSYYLLPHVPLAGKADRRLATELERQPLPKTRAGWEQRLHAITDGVSDLIEALTDSGVLVDNKGEESLRNAFDQHPRVSDITLMLTSDCNLRCRYCYAEGGRRAQVMSRSLIDHSLSYFWRERFSGGSAASLSFHGGGEPTLMFRDMDYCMGRFSEEATRRGVTPNYSVATNGTFCEGARRVLSGYRVGMTLSWDGPPDIQHRQRPADSDRPYIQRLIDNLRWAMEEGLEVNVRATVMRESLPRMGEIVAYFADLGLRSVNLEPCSVDGRAETSMAPDRTAFAEVCADLMLAHLPQGFKVASTFLAWGKFSSRFCGMTTKNCMVTTNGHLSSCYEALNVHSARERPYLFGRIHPSTGVVTLDQRKRSHISSRSTSEIADCVRCPFQHSCAGWCPFKVSRAGFDYRTGIDPGACAAVRAGTTRLVEGLADGEWSTMKTIEVRRRPNSSINGSQ
jgi:uncharacterized protein